MKNWFWKKTDQHAKKKCHGSGFQGKFVSWSGRIWYCKRIISKELSGTAYNSQVLLRGLTWLVWLLVEWLRGNWRHCNRWFAESHFKIKTSPVLKNCCYCSLLHCVQLLWPHGLYPTRLLCPWDFPGKNTGVGCHFLLQGIFLIQGSNLPLLCCRWILHHWATREGPFYILTHKRKIETNYFHLLGIVVQFNWSQSYVHFLVIFHNPVHKIIVTLSHKTLKLSTLLIKSNE